MITSQLNYEYSSKNLHYFEIIQQIAKPLIKLLDSTTHLLSSMSLVYRYHNKTLIIWAFPIW